MRILVASAFEASSPLAHAINTAKMAQGFARLGHDVTLVCIRAEKGRISPEELSEIYGLTEPIHWIQLPRKILGCAIDQHWRFAFPALYVLLRTRPQLVYSRNYIFPWLSSRLGFTTAAESHAYPENTTPHFLRLVKATRHRAFCLWVTISKHLADHYASLGVPKEKLIVLPDAVDLRLFLRPESLPVNPYSTRGPNIAYVGHLYDYKGIPTILKTAALLPDMRFHIIGGSIEDLTRHQERARALNLRNVVFYGLRPHTEIPNFLWHADILLLPPSQNHPSAVWTSPVKLGEYLASGTPVVASDIPALRDWLTDDDVHFVRPDCAKSLAKGIRQLLRNKERSEKLRLSGLEKAQTLSYKQRAQTIIDLCFEKCSHD